MITFPLDNTEYDAKALGSWCGTRTRGVYSANEHFTVSPGSGMTVSVSSGLAWLKRDKLWGVSVVSEEAVSLTLDYQAMGSRTDAIALRLNKIANKSELLVVKGNPSPAAPTRNDYYDDLYLATVTVREGVLTLKNTDIQDQRLNENYCGLMRDGVTGIPTQALYTQWQDYLSDQRTAFTEWWNSIKGTISGDAVGNILALIDNCLKKNETAANTQKVSAAVIISAVSPPVQEGKLWLKPVD